MDYKISEDRLNQVFSRFMEKTFGELFVPEERYPHVKYKDSSGEDKMLGLIHYDRYAARFVFVIDNDAKVKNIKNTFGDMWENLLLTYINNKFPGYNVEEITW